MTLDELRKAADHVRAQLEGHPDVTAIGIGGKSVAGTITERRAVVVHVEAKGQPRGAPIPPAFDTPFGRVETDIEQVPRAALRVATANTVLDGADVVVAGHATRQGTIAFVADGPGASPTRYAITNAHVVTSPGNSGVGSRAFTQPPGKARFAIGTVAAHTSYRRGGINASDVAVIDLDPALDLASATWTVDPWRGRKITGDGILSASAAHGAQDTYHYASMARGFVDEVACRDVRELDRGVTLRDGATTVRFSRAWRLTAAAPGILPGHSGSILVRKEANGIDLTPMGMLFGGSGDVGIFLSWTQVKAALRALAT